MPNFLAALPPTRTHAWRWLIPFSIGPLVMGVISVLAWLVVGRGVVRGPQRIEYVIPAGTAQRVAAGEDLTTIPANAVFVVGDVLVVRNEDSAHHQIGPLWVPAGATLSTPLNRANSFNYLCTVHPSGVIGFEVRPQNSLLLALLPTLVLGVPMGAALSLIARVVSAL